MSGLLELLTPTRCLGCGVVGALPWCVACRAAVERLAAGERCGRCGGDATLGGCVPPTVPRTAAAWTYRDVVAGSVVAAKVRGASAAWGGVVDAGVAVLAPRVDALLADGAATTPVVVAVPCDPVRRRRRGLDHTAVLASTLATALGLPLASRVLTASPAPSRAARRVRSTRPATSGRSPGSPDAPRFALGDRSGSLRAVAELGDLDVVLVDDVLTQGATLAGAAAALRAARARRVTGAVLARAPTAGTRPHRVRLPREATLSDRPTAR